VSGSGVICPGSGHSAIDRSLSVTPSAAVPAGFLAHSFSPGDVPIACKDYVRARLGLSLFRPGRELKAAPQLDPKPVEEARQAPDNREAALNIWRQAIDPHGTLVEQYLKSRALELPDKAANEAVRFLPDCVFGSECFPAMACLVRNIVTSAAAEYGAEFRADIEGFASLDVVLAAVEKGIFERPPRHGVTYRGFSLQPGEPIDPEDPIELIDLVLETYGEQTIGLFDHFHTA
jgi:hypothetical protein